MWRADDFFVGHICGTRIEIQVPNEGRAGRAGLRSGDLRLNVGQREQAGVNLDASDDPVEFFPPTKTSPVPGSTAIPPNAKLEFGKGIVTMTLFVLPSIIETKPGPGLLLWFAT